MHNTIEGVYRDGKIELREAPPKDVQQARVLVTFLVPAAANAVNLGAKGIDPNQAASLRARLATFAEDWERPEMDAYD